MLQNKHHLLVLALLPVLTAETCGARKGPSTASAPLTGPGNQSLSIKMPDSTPVQAKASTAIEAGTQVPQPTSGNRNQPGQTEAMKPSAESETEEKKVMPQSTNEDTESEVEDGGQGKKKKKGKVRRAISKAKKKLFGKKKSENQTDSDADTDTDD